MTILDSEGAIRLVDVFPQLSLHHVARLRDAIDIKSENELRAHERRNRK
jgi:hypothetical protein